MSSSSVTSEQRVVLDKISWQKFENLLAELGTDVPLASPTIGGGWK